MSCQEIEALKQGTPSATPTSQENGLPSQVSALPSGGYVTSFAILALYALIEFNRA